MEKESNTANASTSNIMMMPMKYETQSSCLFALSAQREISLV